MSMDLCVGNLDPRVTADDLVEFFGRFGTVRAARLVRDPASFRPTGFAFVDLEDETEDAVLGTDGAELLGRTMVVVELVSNPYRRGGVGS